MIKIIRSDMLPLSLLVKQMSRERFTYNSNVFSKRVSFFAFQYGGRELGGMDWMTDGNREVLIEVKTSPSDNTISLTTFGEDFVRRYDKKRRFAGSFSHLGTWAELI